MNHVALNEADVDRAAEALFIAAIKAKTVDGLHTVVIHGNTGDAMRKFKAQAVDAISRATGYHCEVQSERD